MQPNLVSNLFYLEDVLMAAVKSLESAQALVKKVMKQNLHKQASSADVEAALRIRNHFLKSAK